MSTEVKHVYKAINAVQSDLSKVGIGKDQTNQHQGFKFRGIDQVYNTLAPLLAKHHLIILPRVMARDVTERQTQRGVLFYVVLTVEYDFISADDGSSHTVIAVGEAMDSGDKATNKAMSAAYKYACFQAFAIPTEGDNDPDGQTHVVQPNPAPRITKTQAEQIRGLLVETGTELNKFLSVVKADSVEGIAASQFEYVVKQLTRKLERAHAA